MSPTQAVPVSVPKQSKASNAQVAVPSGYVANLTDSLLKATCVGSVPLRPGTHYYPRPERLAPGAEPDRVVIGAQAALQAPLPKVPGLPAPLRLDIAGPVRGYISATKVGNLLTLLGNRALEALQVQPEKVIRISDETFLGRCHGYAAAAANRSVTLMEPVLQRIDATLVPAADYLAAQAASLGARMLAWGAQGAASLAAGYVGVGPSSITLDHDVIVEGATLSTAVANKAMFPARMPLRPLLEDLDSAFKRVVESRAIGNVLAAASLFDLAASNASVELDAGEPLKFQFGDFGNKGQARANVTLQALDLKLSLKRVAKNECKAIFSHRVRVSVDGHAPREVTLRAAISVDPTDLSLPRTVATGKPARPSPSKTEACQGYMVKLIEQLLTQPASGNGALRLANIGWTSVSDKLLVDGTAQHARINLKGQKLSLSKADPIREEPSFIMRVIWRLVSALRSVFAKLLFGVPTSFWRQTPLTGVSVGLDKPLDIRLRRFGIRALDYPLLRYIDQGLASQVRYQFVRLTLDRDLKHATVRGRLYVAGMPVPFTQAIRIAVPRIGKLAGMRSLEQAARQVVDKLVHAHVGDLLSMVDFERSNLSISGAHDGEIRLDKDTRMVAKTSAFSLRRNELKLKHQAEISAKKRTSPVNVKVSLRAK